ncbi:MAG: ERMES complex subunit mmm1 [Thelocarpon impressellum]|nr:MAG: ERMES complex subunit mmm1 [Thelocarpon impressellum]
MLSNLSFTQGFLLGQLSIVLLIGAFIKFFIFGDLPSADSTATARATARRQRTLAHKRSVSSHKQQQLLRRKQSGVLRGAGAPPLTTATILSKTYYNVDVHQPESVDWFNVLVAQTIAQLRSDARRDDAILASLDSALNGGQKPEFLDGIRVTELSLGEDFPIFSNCRVRPVDDGHGGGGSEGGRLEARMDVDLSDLLTLGVETRLLLNYPKPLAAVLPVALAVSVVRFSGTLSISFIPSSPSGPSPTTLAFSFLDDYRLEFSIRSLLGSRSRLQDVPKITQLVESRLHSWFDERCVEPRFQQIVLPSLWPRKQTTRGCEDEDGGGERADPDLREAARTEVEAERREAEREEERAVEEDAAAGGTGADDGRATLRRRTGSFHNHQHKIPGAMPSVAAA